MRALLLGDLCPTERNSDLFVQGDMDALFSDTLSLFSGNDLTLVNLECALTERDTPIRKIGGLQKAPRQTARVMKALGVDLCVLSNNHIMDFGPGGISDTLEALEAEGIPHTGFGRNYADSRKNYLLEKDGERIAFVAVCEHEYCYAMEDRMGARPFD